jgi:hypothetical protein
MATHKALALPGTKTVRHFAGRGKESKRIVHPEEVVPLEKDSFKDS